MDVVFPDKSVEFRRDMERKFIRHFGDVIAEFIKAWSMSGAELRRRFKVHIDEEMRDILLNEDVFIAGAHVNNWEWAVITAGDRMPVRTVAVYKPLSNRVMDKLMLDLRKKIRTEMVPMALVIRDILSQDKSPSVYFFLSDQSTPFTMTAHWPVFFGRKTPFVSGMSAMAVRRNIPIYYLYIEKIRRGYYEARFTLMVKETEKLTPEEITGIYSKKLMENILNQPECWLWTHKRWKRVLKY